MSKVTPPQPESPMAAFPTFEGCALATLKVVYATTVEPYADMGIEFTSEGGGYYVTLSTESCEHGFALDPAELTRLAQWSAAMCAALDKINGEDKP